ncbi:baseplate wedge subunit [Cyanophage S-RIM4]|nr:baseplate wedge subunit [Cyanophage S-RIM4]
MQPNNLTALDFEDIKASIKSYLRTRTEFTDYDFEGSSLSYMVDLLAYNSYYSAFMANMSMNEAFISSATIRDNVVNVAKLLNYTPRSTTASTAYFHLDIQTELTGGVYPNNITLPAGPIATGGNYTWNLLESRTAEVNQTTGIAQFRCVKVQEGSVINFSYVVNNFIKQKFIIPSEDADTSTLTVSVRANENTTDSDTYNLVENITNIKSTDRIYFLSETEDMRYELTFGDGVIGRKLGDGEVIDLEYLVTAGAEANGVATFTFVATLTDSLGVNYDPEDVDLTVAETSKFGAAEESIESIKFQAPRYYSTQYRAVTSSDYEVITKKLYDNTKTVVAYGGDELSPPVYGKVYVAIKTKSGSKLNDTTKKSISQQLKPYAMASIEPVIVDADSIYIYPKVFITYDPACSARSVSGITANAQNAINEWASQTGINNFNGNFSLSKFTKAITLADRCIADVTTQISLVKYINPAIAETNTYCISTGSPLYNSAPGNDGSGGGEDCYKEPVVKSSKFRTKDRPTVDQYFEDTGFGKLYTYYNSGNRKIITNNDAGTVNYDTGEICFGPTNVIGSGGNNLPVDDLGNVDDSDQAKADLGEIRIAVQIIPANSSTIGVPDPSTVLEIVIPTISVNPIGTILPSSIPLNSLAPSDFEVTPVTIEIPDITVGGDLSFLNCF